MFLANFLIKLKIHKITTNKHWVIVENESYTIIKTGLPRKMTNIVCKEETYTTLVLIVCAENVLCVSGCGLK